MDVNEDGYVKQNDGRTIKVTKINSENDVKRKVLLPQSATNAAGAVVDCIPESSSMKFDEFLVHAGELGWYQALIFVSTMPFYLYDVFVYFSQLLMTQTGGHWCWVPELAHLSAEARREAAIPRDRAGYSQCTQYVRNWSEPAAGAGHPWPTAPCLHGWEFDAEIPYPTIGSELQWVCERAAHQSIAQAVFFAGSVCGLLAVGWLADRHGRLCAVVVYNLLGCLGGFASTFATNLLQFSVARFFVGLSCDNCMMISYLLVLEYIAPKYRTMVSNTAFAVFYTLGAVSLPWIALACGNWKTFGLVTSLPMALAVLAPFILHESPMWLMSKGRIDQVVKNVEAVGRVNKKPISPEVIQQFRDTAATKHEVVDGTILDLLRRPLLSRVFILICVEQICCDMIFDCSIRCISVLDYDFFVTLSLISLTEFPGILAAAFAMDWLGRRWLTNITLLAASVLLILTAFVSNVIVSVACAVIARFFINIAFITVMQWGAELLPTPVRASGVSVIHMFGSVGTILTQFIVYLGTYIAWLPLVIAAGIAALGAIVALALPETMQKQMPQTFDEAEELARTPKLLVLNSL